MLRMSGETVILHCLDNKEAEDDSHTKHPELLEQDPTTDSAQGTSSSHNQWKTAFTTVTTLIATALLYAGISMIAPFYPIVVSSINSYIPYVKKQVTKSFLKEDKCM